MQTSIRCTRYTVILLRWEKCQQQAQKARSISCKTGSKTLTSCSVNFDCEQQSCYFHISTYERLVQSTQKPWLPVEWWLWVCFFIQQGVEGSHSHGEAFCLEHLFLVIKEIKSVELRQSLKSNVLWKYLQSMDQFTKVQIASCVKKKHIRTHTRMHAHTQTYTCTHTHTHTHTHTNTHTQTHYTCGESSNFGTAPWGLRKSPEPYACIVSK